MIIVKLFSECIGQIYVEDHSDKVYFKYSDLSPTLDPFPGVFPKRKEPYCLGYRTDNRLDGFPGVFCENSCSQDFSKPAYECLKYLGPNLLGALEFECAKEEFNDNLDVPYNFVGGKTKKYCTQHWIIKAENDHENSRELLLLEYSLNLLAKEVGIPCVDMEICFLNNRLCLKIKRFDRSNHKRIHYQSCHSLAQKKIEIKENVDYNYILDVIPNLDLDHSNLFYMFKVITLNFCIHNNDDHLVNIGFLMGPEGKWRLAPIFDLGFSLKPRFVKLNGKFQNITRSDLMSFGSKMGLSIPEMNEALDSVSGGIPHWPEIALRVGLKKNQIDYIYSFFRTFYLSSSQDAAK